MNNEAWKKMAAQVEKMTDGIGQPVDEGIKDLVIVCNLLGLNTDASCEGHFDWAIGGPYVDFSSPDAQQYEKRYIELSDEMGVSSKPGELGKLIDDDEKVDAYFKDERFIQIRKDQDKANAQVFKKVLDLLHEFYEKHERKPNIAIQFTNFRIASEGTVIVPALDDAGKKQFLADSRQEFDKFKDFLIDKWSGKKQHA